jgi:hypothetical protein
METIIARDTLAALPTAFQRTLNTARYPMPGSDNTDRQLASAYRVRFNWWVDLAAAYLPHIEAAADEEGEWLPLMESAKLALARADYWGCIADSIDPIEA